jgi:7-carboxy-7-deazaguanine synthase
MNICEIFYSIQGESTFAGLPCIFIRLSGCNLRCKYCDTIYSYEPGIDYTIDQILQEISQFNSKLVLITGGEPLLQEETIELMECLHTAGYQVLLETNGSQPIQQVPSFVYVILDVKLPGSGYPDSFLMANIDWIKESWDELKFVISDKADFDFACDFIKTQNLMNHKLLFSPITDKLNPAILADWIKELDFPVRLNLQLHKIIWDKNTRGV